MMTEIVRAGSEHLPGILEIEQAEFSVPWSEAGFRAEIEAEDCIFLAAADGADVLGFCILRCFGDEGEIFNIAVSKNAKRSGLGSRLMEKALELGAAAGVKQVFLEVRAGNVPAIGLYRKFGFVPVGIRKNYYNKPVEDALLMMRGEDGIGE